MYYIYYVTLNYILMPLKNTIKKIEITSGDMGYINIERKSNEVDPKREDIWLEIAGSEDYPLIITNLKELNELAAQILDCAKLFK